MSDKIWNKNIYERSSVDSLFPKVNAKQTIPFHFELWTLNFTSLIGLDKNT